jgi:hypothetical protein
MLNNLTNFANIIRERMVKKVLVPTDLIAVGRADAGYNGGYRPIAISASDLINQIAEPSVTFVQGSFDPQVQATMTPILGTITYANSTVVFDRYRVQGTATLSGAGTYAYLIGVVVGSTPLLRVREDSTILATDTNVYDTVASAMNFNVLVKDGTGALISTISAFIADDNTISSPDEHWFTLVMTAGVPFSADVSIDFTIAVPQGPVIEFFN